MFFHDAMVSVSYVILVIALALAARGRLTAHQLTVICGCVAALARS